MERRHSILLFAASAVAGAFLLAALREPRAPEESCAETNSCSAQVAAPAAEAPPPTTPPPVPDVPPAAPVEPVPVDGAALRAEADRMIAEGSVKEGLDVFRRAVEAEPTAKNHGDLGTLLYKLTAFDEAATHLRAAAELDPGNADRWIALANVYYRKVDLGEAWKAEKRAREAEPGLEMARDGSGMRVRKGDSAPRQP
jgi:tetratricopeptide (TPR) repeat protein